MALDSDKVPKETSQAAALEAAAKQLYMHGVDLNDMWEAFVEFGTEQISRKDFIEKAASLNISADLTGDERTTAIAERTKIIEEILQTASTDQIIRAFKDIKDKEFWTAAELALDTTNAMNPWRAIGNFAGSLWYNLVSFWVGDIKHGDTYARHMDMARDYDPRPGDEKYDPREMMPDAYASFLETEAEKAAAGKDATEPEREARGLDGASKDLRQQFPESAAVQTAEAKPAAALEVTFDT